MIHELLTLRQIAGLCVLCFFLGATLINAIGPNRRRVRKLTRALQGLNERYGEEIKASSADRQAWAAERNAIKEGKYYTNKLIKEQLDIAFEELNRGNGGSRFRLALETISAALDISNAAS